VVSDSEAGHGNDCAFGRSSVTSGRGDIGGSFAAAGGRAVQGERSLGGSLGSTPQPNRRCGSSTEGRQEPLTVGAACGLAAGLDHRGTGPDAGSDRAAAVGRSWAEDFGGRGSSLLQAARDHLQKKTLHAAEQDRPDVSLARERWKASQASLDPTKLVFVDETGANTKMVRVYGRSRRGKRLVCKTPWGHWKTTTFTCGLRCDGLVAPWVLEGPMTGDAFRVYVEKVLVPTLSRGDTVIIDNLASHKVAGVREAIEAVGAKLLYLPPYSPDLNPIELAFAKFKTGLRKAAERTVDDLWRRIGVLIHDFPPQECQNYFCHDGYASS
jgi:transposase